MRWRKQSAPEIFMADPDFQRSAGRAVQGPGSAMINENGRQTYLEYNGTVPFTVDPLEA
jgi:hypothetical protein